MAIVTNIVPFQAMSSNFHIFTSLLALQSEIRTLPQISCDFLPKYVKSMILDAGLVQYIFASMLSDWIL